MKSKGHSKLADAGATRMPSASVSNKLNTCIKESLVSGLSFESVDERLDVCLIRAGKSCDGFVPLRVRSPLDINIDLPMLLIDTDFGPCVPSRGEPGNEAYSAMRRDRLGSLLSSR